VRAPTLEPHPRPCTASALTACCLPSRLAGCSSSPPRTTTILGSLGISGAMQTYLQVHILRADAVVGTESARLIVFARGSGARVGTRTGCGCTCSVFMGSHRHHNLSSYHRGCLGRHGLWI
jgi:hypothetical protein